MRKGWIETTLGEVAELNPEATKNFPADRVIRYIDLASVSHEAGISPNLTELEYGDAPGRARRVVRAADILVSTVRPYLKGFAQVPKHLDGEVASTGFAVVRANQDTTLAGFVWALVGTADFV
ncbi:MAG: restriction endonuclease subunit S, partial [Planctomycetes bacterium]|nr:restriction endonuclease subunit S [Planctomycetota bacterium]